MDDKEIKGKVEVKHFSSTEHLKLWTLKLKLRKWTTPFHILSGLLIAALIPYYPIASVLLLAGFGFFEWWNWKILGDTSDMDFWEGLAAMFVGCGIVLLLTLLHII
jgi:hypothetical protein